MSSAGFYFNSLICPSTAYEGAQSLYTHPMWMWDAVNGDLQPQPWHHNAMWAPPYHNFLKFCPHLHRYNSVSVDPYAHPRHMKVLKHFVYFQYRCGMQSVVAYSLNHDTLMSFGLHLTPIFQNLAPICTGISYTCAPSTAYEGAQSLSIHPMWMWDAISGSLQPQPWHHNIIWASPYPNFQNFAPHLHRVNHVRVHQYAHPQHMKVLEHFIHIQDGCGMQ